MLAGNGSGIATATGMAGCPLTGRMSAHTGSPSCWSSARYRKAKAFSIAAITHLVAAPITYVPGLSKTTLLTGKNVGEVFASGGRHIIERA